MTITPSSPPELCPDCQRPQLRNMKRYRKLQSTGEHKAWCGRELNALECELECDRFTISRLRLELSKAHADREADRNATRLAAKLEALGELKRLVETLKWLDQELRKESGWGRAYQAAMKQLETKYTQPAQPKGEK